jgi:hypothetical protein
VALDQRPHLGQAVPGEGAAGDDRGRPAVLGPSEQPQRAGQLASGPAGLVLVRAVGLVHGDDVGELEHALLDPLELVAGAGQGQQQERVGHLRHQRLRLADPDRLDEQDVVAGGGHDDQRLPGRAGDAAEGARRRGRAHEGGRVSREPGHPGLVAEDAAAAAGRRRVDRQHRDPVPVVDELAAEGVDEGGLADAGDAGDADPLGRPRVRQQPGQHVLGEDPVVRAARLDQRDRAGDAGPRPGEDRVCVPRCLRPPVGGVVHSLTLLMPQLWSR